MMRIISYETTYQPAEDDCEPESETTEHLDREIGPEDWDEEQYGSLAEARIAAAVMYLRQFGPFETCCYPSCENSCHCWLTTSDMDENYITGERTSKSFHLKGYSPFEHGEIIKACTKNK